MPRHDDLFDFSPEALKRVQQVTYKGLEHSYIGTAEPNTIFSFGLVLDPKLRGQGIHEEYIQKLNEHCDATGTTRIAMLGPRGGMPLDKLIEFYRARGFETRGEIKEFTDAAGVKHPYVDVIRRPQPPDAPP
ncbi:MAG: hypothetical protein EHM35_05500 [Planctomycetaceae bacterium]|nr:MAG: hypothetical protein EHM35_05500 [Planctomycetaceae bacterium]